MLRVPVAARAAPRPGTGRQELLHRQLQCEITARRLPRLPGPTATARPLTLCSRPVTHSGMGAWSRGKDRLGRKPGGGICWIHAALPSQRCILPALLERRAPGAGALQQQQCLGQMQNSFAAAWGHSLPCRAAPGPMVMLLTAGRQVTDMATFTAGFNMKHATGTAPWFPTHCQGVGRPLATEFRVLHEGERTGSLSLSFYVCRKKHPSQDNLLTQITFHSYLIMLVSHTDKLLARLSEPWKGPPHEFSDSVETCQCPFLFLTKQPQQGKLWCKAHSFCKAAPFVSGLPWMKHDLQFPHLNPSNILCSLLVSLPFSSAWEKARSSQSASKDAYSRL